MKANLFKDTPLGPYFERAGLCLWDVGARGGIDPHFAAFAWAVDAVGFEPDPESFQALRPSGLWRSERFLAVAIGAADGEGVLNVPADPAGASFLEHDRSVGRRYHLDALFDVRERVEVPVRAVDGIVRAGEAPAPGLLKLDVEGHELAVVEGAAETLGGVAAIKLEAAFLEQRIGQPLAHDIAAFLGARGFCLADIVDAVRWRVRPWAADPYMVRGEPAYSRGRLAQADLIFLREPAAVPAGLAAKAALAAAGLGYFDHAAEIAAAHAGAFPTPEDGEDDFAAALSRAARRYGRARGAAELRAGAARLLRLARSTVFGLRVPPGTSG